MTTDKLREAVQRVKHEQHTTWKDGIDIEECWPSCVRCAIEAALADSAVKVGAIDPQRLEAAMNVRMAVRQAFDVIAKANTVTVLSLAEMEQVVLKELRAAAPASKVAAPDDFEPVNAPDIFRAAHNQAVMMKQMIGAKNNYYITLAQLESILKEALP